jgi:RNA polymerase sigma-70 factor (ECF subfamily)
MASSVGKGSLSTHTSTSNALAELDDVVVRAQAGDRQAVGELYRALSGPLLSYLMSQVRRSEDAEDLLGQVFLDAIRDIGRFQGDASGFRAWLFRIAHNRAIDLARRLSRRAEVPLADAEAVPEESDAEEQALEGAERDRLWRAVRRLPPAQREVIALRLAAGLSSPEIASALSKRVGAVKALQHRALENLAKALQVAYPSKQHSRLNE